MTEKQMRNYVRGLYKHKKIRDYQFRNAVSNLENLRDSDLLFYYFNMGKLHTAFGNAEDAVVYLEKTIKLKPDYAAAYYNLYKCYVKLDDIKMAQISFKKFLESSTADVNFEFVVNILNAINAIDNDFIEYLSGDFFVPYTSKIGYNNLEDNEELKNIYFEVLRAFNDRDYLMCLKKLEVMNSKINKMSYPMEVDTLISIIKCLKDKEIMYYSECLKDGKSIGISDEDYVNILLRLYNFGCYSEKSFLRRVEDVILNDSYVKGEIILDRISVLKEFRKYQDMINYLNGIVREKKAFSLLDKEKQDEFTARRLVAKNSYIKKQNEKSLLLYSILKEQFNLPICDYYIGKIMIRMKDFSRARECFLSYLEQGGVKTEKAYMFLAKIEKIKKNNSAAKSYIDKMYRIHEVFLREFEYLPENEYRKFKDGSYKVGDRNSGFLNETDLVKDSAMRIIKMSEEDFLEDKPLEVTDFYDVDIDGKLLIIRNLFRSGNIENANKLFAEVQQDCAPQDVSKIKQFERSKKVYMHQRRNNQT